MFLSGSHCLSYLNSLYRLLEYLSGNSTMVGLEYFVIPLLVAIFHSDDLILSEFVLSSEVVICFHTSCHEISLSKAIKIYLRGFVNFIDFTSYRSLLCVLVVCVERIFYCTVPCFKLFCEGSPRIAGSCASTL